MSELKPCPFCGSERVNVAEIADLITASCNLASALWLDDLRPAMEECRERNEERGRF